MNETFDKKIKRVYIQEGLTGLVLRVKRKTIHAINSLNSRFFINNKKQSMREKNAEEIKHLPLILKSKPILIYAEAVTHCNINCVMCGRQFHKINPKDSGFMTLETFKRLSKIISPGVTLSLFGRGETLMHKDFPKMLQIAKQKGAIVGFNTNGKALTPHIVRKMVEYKQDNLNISFSAGTKKTYERIHKGGSYDRLIESIRSLNNLKKEYNSPFPHLAFEFVAMRSNIEELPSLVRLASELSIPTILVIHVTAHSKEMELSESLRQRKYEKITKRFFEKSLKLASKSCINLVLPDNFNARTKKLDVVKSEVFSKHPNVCLESWETFYVKFNGEVMPCVITNRALGNLNKQSAKQIWNGEIYKKFRAKSKSSDKPPECKICHLLPGNNSYNKDLGDEKIYQTPL